MKSLKILFVAGIIAVAGNALAEDKGLLTERYVSNPPAKLAFVARDYAGISKDKPCSDLVLRAVYDMQADFSDHSFKDDSSVFVYRAGPQATCYKRTLTMARSGNLYSTDNILLKWDEVAQVYTKAAPEIVTVDVSKG